MPRKKNPDHETIWRGTQADWDLVCRWGLEEQLLEIGRLYGGEKIKELLDFFRKLES